MNNTKQNELALLQFVKTYMLLPNGGVRTNYLSMANTNEFATGSDVLSESQGLLMEYALLTQDIALFEQTLFFVEEYLLLSDAISYRYSAATGRYSMNAALDDFRIIRSLMIASEIFGEPRYLELALSCGKYLYKVNVENGQLVDFFDTKYRQPNDTLTLCYADFSTIYLLSAYDTRWESIAKNSLYIIQNGYLGDDFPLFATSYNYETKLYSTNKIETVQSLIVAIHLAQIDLCPDTTIEYIKQSVLSGSLYGQYTAQGVPLNTIESTAIYALAAILGDAVGDKELVNASLTQMERFQIQNRSHILFGSYADADKLEAYSFDNLCALLAYRASYHLTFEQQYYLHRSAHIFYRRFGINF